MTIRTFLIEHLLYPTIDFLRGTDIVAKYKFLLKSQWWERDELDEYQNKKLKILIHHSYENVAYYRQLFKKNNLKPNDINTKDDLKKIPPLTKKIVRRYGASSLLAKNIPKKHLLMGHTGGSTGEPLQFYRDKNSKSWGLGALYRFWNWSGLDFAEKKFQFSGGSLGGFLTQKSKIHLKFEKFLTGTHFFPAFEMYEKNLNKYLLLIEKNKKIRHLRGYPSSLYILARFINNRGLNKIKLSSVLTTAEKLYDFQKNEIQKAFNCPVFDQYGCGEILSIAAQCSEGTIYHIADEHIIHEIDSYDKNIIARITDLDNFASPFIRYENGDLIKPSKKLCECGIRLSTINKIEGRTHDFITTPNGDLIAGEFFPHLFQSIKGIDQYFIFQRFIDQLIISVKPNEFFSQQELDIYINKIREYVGEEMIIEIKIVDDIPLTQTGKRLFIKSNIPIEFD